MIGPFLATAPIFALILAGWLAARAGALGARTVVELNRFVIVLALPALLFDVVSGSAPEHLWDPGFFAAFALSGLICMGLGVALGMIRGRGLADAALVGLNAGYPNVGFMGFPLALSLLGPEALAPTTIAAILTMCVFFALAIVLVEAALLEERALLRLVRKTLWSVLKNPLIFTPALAAIFPLTGMQVPEPAADFLHLLGGAAGPCALVILGLFAAQRPGSAVAAPQEGPVEARRAPPPRDDAALVWGPTLLKLLLQPALAWVLCAEVFGLSPFLCLAATLLAALPTGTGAFMLAEAYGREARSTSRVIILGTALSILTLSVLPSLLP